MSEEKRRLNPIWEYAESINWRSDYMDMNTFNIYKIQAYGHDRDLGLPLPSGIPVVNFEGELIGYAEKYI